MNHTTLVSFSFSRDYIVLQQRDLDFWVERCIACGQIITNYDTRGNLIESYFLPRDCVLFPSGVHVA